MKFCYKKIKLYLCAPFERSIFVSWCNGSTTDFGSVCQGSNPCETTDKNKLSVRGLMAFFISIIEI